MRREDFQLAARNIITFFVIMALCACFMFYAGWVNDGGNPNRSWYIFFTVPIIHLLTIFFYLHRINQFIRYKVLYSIIIILILYTLIGCYYRFYLHKV